MSQEFLLTVLFDRSDRPLSTASRSALKAALRGDGADPHEVWEKRYSREWGQPLALGSIRIVGAADGIHDDYNTHGLGVGPRWKLAAALADQTRKRLLAAGAARCTVTVQALDSAPCVTTDQNGSFE